MKIKKKDKIIFCWRIHFRIHLLSALRNVNTPPMFLIDTSLSFVWQTGMPQFFVAFGFWKTLKLTGK